MKKTDYCPTISWSFASWCSSSSAELDNPGGIGGVESLRKIASELEATRAADDFKKVPS